MTEPSSRAAGASALAEDGISDIRAFLRAPTMIRVDVTPGRFGLSQLALRLNGSADRAIARVVSTGAHESVQVCSAMRSGPGVFAGVATGLATDTFDLANSELLPFGWDRLEHFGERQRRWTRVREAEILVPVVRAEDVQLEIDLEPAGPAGTEFTLRINDVTLPPMSLARGSHTYRFEVPRSAWRPGMNLMRLGTSALVRPADTSPGLDERQLGLAVSGIRFVRIASPGD